MRVCGQVIHCGAKVFGVDVGRRHIARLPAAFARKRRVEGYGEEAALRQSLGVQTRSLFLDGSERAADGDGRQFASGVFGFVHVGCQRDAVTVVERDLDVFHLVAQRERLVPFLRQIQFFFHKLVFKGLISLCHEVSRTAEAGEQDQAEGGDECFFHTFILFRCLMCLNPFHHFAGGSQSNTWLRLQR